MDPPGASGVGTASSDAVEESICSGADAARTTLADKLIASSS